MAIETEFGILEKYGVAWYALESNVEALSNVPHEIRQDAIFFGVPKGGYFLEKVKTNVTKISYSFLVDIRGYIPGWVCERIAYREVERAREKCAKFCETNVTISYDYKLFGHSIGFMLFEKSLKENAEPPEIIFEKPKEISRKKSDEKDEVEAGIELMRINPLCSSDSSSSSSTLNKKLAIKKHERTNTDLTIKPNISPLTSSSSMQSHTVTKIIDTQRKKSDWV